MLPLQYLGASGLGELVLVVLVPLLVVAFGSYVGVLMALQSFFGASTWQEARAASPDTSES
jgi:hypothetical protein